MTIKAFIEAAIEGGWDNTRVSSIWFRQDTGEIVLDLFTIADLSQMCLDPEAWRAVAKVRGWRLRDDENPFSISDHDKYLDEDEWRTNMYRMVTTLIRGKTLEEYIATL